VYKALESAHFHVQATDHETIPRWGGGCIWRGAAECLLLRWDLFADVLPVQTENIEHFEQRAVSQCTVRMLSEWVVGKSSFAKVFRACASPAFLAGIISWSMDNTEATLQSKQLILGFYKNPKSGVVLAPGVSNYNDRCLTEITNLKNQ
jgi:hypothetical protein